MHRINVFAVSDNYLKHAPPIVLLVDIAELNLDFQNPLFNSSVDFAVVQGVLRICTGRWNVNGSPGRELGLADIHLRARKVPTI